MLSCAFAGSYPPSFTLANKLNSIMLLDEDIRNNVYFMKDNNTPETANTSMGFLSWILLHKILRTKKRKKSEKKKWLTLCFVNNF